MSSHLTDDRASTERPVARWVIVAPLAFVALLIVKTAWLCDDASITFRTADNFLNGYGLTWNAAERVQTYSNPLWLMLFTAAYAATGEMHLTALALSIVVSIAAVALYALRVAATPMLAVLGLCVLAFSRAFIDYSTSGLENPATHLLVCIAAMLLMRSSAGKRPVGAIALVAALGCVNRLDSSLYYVPLLVLCAAEHRSWRGWGRIALGLSPLLGWLAFATLYYGFPFPNTAYAKLGAGIARDELVRQGLFYLLNAVRQDPLTPMVLLAGLIAPLALRTRESVALAAGALLHIAYVVYIGGDFMAGRMLTGSLLLAVILLTSVRGATNAAVLPAIAIVLLVGWANPLAPVHTLDSYGFGLTYMDEHGVADERCHYYSHTALLLLPSRAKTPEHPWLDDGAALRAAGPAVVVRDNIGFLGCAAGPHVHIVDRWALGDPLLARLPAPREEKWRIGHFARSVPDGYLESLRSGENVIGDPRLRDYYERLRLVTRGPLFSADRLWEIVRLNLIQPRP